MHVGNKAGKRNKLWQYIVPIFLLVVYCLHKLFLTQKFFAIPNPKEFSHHYEKAHADVHQFKDEFPSYILKTEIRRDVYSDEKVQRGRLEMLGGISNFMSSIGGQFNRSDRRVSYQAFQKILQCAPSEPDIYGPSGSLHLAHLIPVTRRGLEVASAWVETQCEDWQYCDHEANVLAKKYSNSSEERKFPDERTRMLRVINGELFYDWPWGIERFQRGPDYYASRLFGGILELIDDIPDSVFFVRDYDYPLFPANFPIPAFSHAPSIQNADIPNPWIRAVNINLFYHAQQVEQHERSRTSQQPYLNFALIRLLGKIWCFILATPTTMKNGSSASIWECFTACFGGRIVPERDRCEVTSPICMKNTPLFDSVFMYVVGSDGPRPAAP